MSATQVDTAVTNYITVKTINNPAVNTQGRQFHEDMMAAMDALSDRDNVRVVVLTGARKFFSAGADLKATAEWTGAYGEA